MAKKITANIKQCIADSCQNPIRHAGGKSKQCVQYCVEHWPLVQQLRRMREPCRMIRCKNPAHEDGYCDGCRPFAVDVVPLREEWVRKEHRLKSNTPGCLYSQVKVRGKDYMAKAFRERIVKIRTYLTKSA